MRLLKHLLVGGPGGASPLADFGLLILRLGVGLLIALGHGRFKFPPPERFVEGVGRMGFPAPTAFAWMAAFAEFGGGLLLALGLLTRPAAFLVASTMAVAALVTHGGDPLFMQSAARGDPSKEPALLYLAPALALLFTGSGRFGVDALFWRRGERGREFPVERR
jgi:putative oxidoreductase